MKTRLLAIIMVLSSTGSVLAGMTPQAFYDIEVRARELTLEGLENRLSCMQNGCPLEEQYAIDEEYRLKVVALHNEAATTPSRLSGWYSRNKKTTDTYLLTHPRLQLQLDELDTSFETLSDAINTLREAQ